MNKVLCVATLLLGTITLAGRNSTAGQSVITSPTIVAKLTLTNQTANIPTTTLFTPTSKGLYRLSAYMVQTQLVLQTPDNWNLELGWTDDAGPETDSGTLLLSPQGPPYGNLGWQPGSVSVIEVAANQPITFGVTGASQGQQLGVYNIYLVLEKL